MDQEWRHSAKSVTKYDPIFRDGDGRYQKEEWIGFFQVGANINGEVLTFKRYSDIEAKYITAALLFFQHHNCTCIQLRNVEKNGSFDQYVQADKEELLTAFNAVEDGILLPISNAGTVIKLILREFMWAELLCKEDESIAVRFGHDFYMYFNSNKDMEVLIDKITESGLFVW